ncbi:Rhamnan synthesis F [Durusdinium trenchii]
MAKLTRIADTDAGASSVADADWTLNPTHFSQSDRPFFLLWSHDFDLRDDTNFILDFAAGLTLLDHRVVLESPVDGEALKNLDPKHDFGARVNHRLKKILTGQKSNLWDVMLDAELPHCIIFFSSAWIPFFLQLSQEHPGVQLVWYFYRPHMCGLTSQTQTERSQIGEGMAKADWVVFLNQEDQLDWSHDKLGNYRVFHPFMPTTLEPADVRDVRRNELRQEQGLKPEVFLISIALDCPIPEEEVDVFSTGISKMLTEKFGSSWFVMVFGEGKAEKANFLSKDPREVVKYLAAVDLHISLTRSALALDSLYARALGVSVLMRDTWDTSEAGEPRTVRLPRTVTQETLEKSLAEILNLTDRELNSVRTQDRLAVQTRSGETAAVRVALMSRMLLESREPVERGLRIGIYIQLSNLGLWKRLKACVLTILEATMDENAPNSTRKSTVDVILTVTEEHKFLRFFLPALRQAAPPSSSLRLTALSFAEARSADNGLFLQQLLLARDLQVDHDLILKLHSKEEPRLREMILGDLCGSVEGVRAALEQFQKDQRLGMIGPTSLTWTKEGSTKHVAFNLATSGFGKTVVKRFQNAWSLLSPRKLPHSKKWTIVAGSMYWVRAGLLLWNNNLPSSRIPKFLDACPEPACSAGLERLFPTFIADTKHRVVALSTT